MSTQNEDQASKLLNQEQSESPRTSEYPPEDSPESSEPSDSPTGLPSVENRDQGTGKDRSSAPIEDTKDLRPDTFAGKTPWVLLGLVLLLAFLQSSFAVRNADFWLHLATGKYLLGNITQVGVDPFGNLSEGVLCVNHHWVYDIGLYQAYSAFGGGVVVLKGLVVVGIISFLLLTRPRSQNLSLTAFGMLLAVLTMGPWLLLRPMLFSMLFAAGSLYILLVSSEHNTTRLWWLVPLCVIWANFDGWYLLGPLMVLCALLGEWLRRRAMVADTSTETASETTAGSDEPNPKEGLTEEKPAKTNSYPVERIRTLGWVTLACFLACFCTPYLHRGLTLPTELGYVLAGFEGWCPAWAAADGLALRTLVGDQAYRLPGMEGWVGYPANAVPSNPKSIVDVASFSFYLLLLGGLVSFGMHALLDREEGNLDPIWARLFLWLVFLLLTFPMPRLFPLFAVVAAPIMTWNFTEFFRRAGNPIPVPVLLAGRVLLWLCLLYSVLFTWAGWLRGRVGMANSYYRVSWAIVPDESLQEAAKSCGELQEASGVRLRIFNDNPDFACYCAYYAPEVWCTYDYRFGLVLDFAETLSKARTCLRLQDHVGQVLDHVEKLNQGRAGLPQQSRLDETTRQEVQTTLKDLRTKREFLKETLQDFWINHVVWSGAHKDKQAWQFSVYVSGYPANWDLVQADGRTIHYRYHPPSDPVRSDFAQDWTSRAFVKHGGAFRYDAELVEETNPPTWWRRFVGTIPVKDRESYRSLWLAQCAEIQERLAKQQTRILSYQLQFQRKGQGPLNIAPIFLRNLLPGTPHLAVQAARKGIIEDPYSSRSWMALSRAHKKLWAREDLVLGAPRNRGPVSYRTHYRELIQSYSLKQEVERNPTSWQAHNDLGRLYQKQNCWDLAAAHLRFAYELQKNNVPESKMLRRQFRLEMDRLKKDVERLETEVKVRTTFLDKKYADAEASRRVRMGLARPFFYTDGDGRPQYDKFGCRLARRQLELIDEGLRKLPSGNLKWLILKYPLLLVTGHPRQVLKEMAALPDHPLFAINRGLYETKAYAMLGAYALLEEAFERLETAQGNTWDPQQWGDAHGKLVTESASVLGPMNLVGLHPSRRLVASFAYDMVYQYRRMTVAQVRNLRGIFALEGGNVPLAEAYFRDVRKMDLPRNWNRDLPLASYYLQIIEQANR
ncbi:MAG: hypothetical protein ACFCD0_08680 [Gemmataceae bacterium]